MIENSNDKIEFCESRFGALKILFYIFGGVSLMFALLFIFGESPEGALQPLDVLPVLAAIFGGATLLTFLILIFQKRKKIVCDSEKCEISETKYWGNPDESIEVKWSDVTGSYVCEKQHDAPGGEGIIAIYYFTLETAEYGINLLNLKGTSKVMANGFINYVNNHTPQLDYKWVHKSNTDNREILESVYKYRKVKR